MKTIEEKAKEYAQSISPHLYHQEFLIKAFIAGCAESAVRSLNRPIQNNGNNDEFPTHPATCDCSGKERCERLNKVSQGEMKCKDGLFVCQCGVYVQHKCTSQ